MNPQNLEKILKPSNEVSLDQEKKQQIRQELLLFMKNNPIKPIPQKQGWRERLQPFMQWRMSMALATFLLFFAAGGFAMVKANSSLPGETLYPIKREVNEKILQVLAFNQDAKASLNISLAKERLQEAEALALKGNFDAKANTDINNNFTVHAKAVTDYLSKLDTDQDHAKAEDVASEFEASLNAHGVIMENLGQNISNSIINELLGQVKVTQNIVAQARASASTKSAAKAQTDEKTQIAKKKAQSIEKSVQKAKQVIQKNKALIGAQAAIEAENNLNLIEQTLRQTNQALTQQDANLDSSISSLQEASLKAKASTYLLEAQAHLKTSFPLNIKIEHLPLNNTSTDNAEDNKTEAELNLDGKIKIGN